MVASAWSAQGRDKHLVRIADEDEMHKEKPVDMGIIDRDQVLWEEETSVVFRPSPRRGADEP